jgi:glycerol-3-phosphate dehydrogenase
MNLTGETSQRGKSLGRLEAEIFDLLVVGGGIHGVAATLEASRRGFHTALVEQDDFGSATSRNSLQVLHGGLRYLQTLNAHRFCESVGDRAFFLREFPELTTPMRFVLPLDGKGLRRPSLMKIALGLNDWASRPLQEDLPASHALAAGEVWSRDDLRSLYPEIAAAEFVGAAVWSDGHLSSPQRVLIEMLRWAAAAEALPVNHARVRSCVSTAGVLEVEVEDRLSGRSLLVRARKVLFCGGPWSRELACSVQQGSAEDRVSLGGGAPWGESVPSGNVAAQVHPLSLAFNLVLRGSLPRPYGVGLTGRSGRNLFLWERDGLIRLGTCHTPWPSDVSDSPFRSIEPSELEMETFLQEAAEAAPGLALDQAERIGVQSGVLTAKSVGARDLAPGDAIVRHRDHGGPEGVASVHGVKYTSAPSSAIAGLESLWGKLPPRSTQARPPSRGALQAAKLVERAGEDSAKVRAILSDLWTEEWVTSEDELLRGRIDGTEDPLLLAQLRRYLGQTPTA